MFHSYGISSLYAQNPGTQFAFAKKLTAVFISQGSCAKHITDGLKMHVYTYVVSVLCIFRLQKEIISCFLFTEITSKVRPNQRVTEWKLSKKQRKKRLFTM